MLVHDETVAGGDDAAKGEADGCDEFFSWSARGFGQVGFVDELDVQGLHGFLYLVLLALLDEIGVNVLLGLCLTLELEIGGCFVRRIFADSLLELAIKAIEPVFAREVGKLLGYVVVVSLGIFNTFIEELDKKILGLLAVIGLHGQKVVNDLLLKNIDKSVYVLEIFLIHRARSRCPERHATNVCIALQRRKFPTSHRYIYRNFCY